jgi:hypothetical protein
MIPPKKTQLEAALTYSNPLSLAHSAYFPVYIPPRITIHSPPLLKKRGTHTRRTASTTTTTKTDDDSFPMSLHEKFVGDIAVGTTVTAATSAILAVVDKALVQRSMGSHTLMASMKTTVTSMLAHPVAYFKSPAFLWMWATYASTYSAANMLRTYTEHVEHVALAQHGTRLPASTTTSTIFVGTTAVNTTASLIKDRAYAKLFGNAAATSVPQVSYALWITRDFTVIGSSFLLPSVVAKYMTDHYDVKEATAQKVAQVATPTVAQIIAGPLHFVGLDCYNRNLSHLPLRTQVAERMHFLKSGAVEVILARMARILPGYGLAGVYNTHYRNQYRHYLIDQQVHRLHQEQQQAAEPSPQGIRNLVALIRSKKEAALHPAAHHHAHPH